MKAVQPPRGWWLRLLRYAAPQWPGLLILALVMAAQSSLAALSPWPMKLVVDHVLSGNALPDAARWIGSLPGVGPADAPRPAALLAWLSVFPVLLFCVGQSVGLLQSFLNVRVAQAMVQSLRARLFDHLQRLSLGFHSRHSVGDLMRRVITDCTCVQGLIIGVGLQRFGTVVRIVVMSVIMLKLDPVLGTIVLLTGLPLGVISRSFNRGMTARAAEEQRLGSEMLSLAEQTLTTLPIVQGFGREDQGDRRFARLAVDSTTAALRLTASQLWFQFGTGSIRSLCRAAIMLIGGWHVLNGTLSIGSLWVFLSYLGSLLGPLEGLAYASVGIATSAAGAARVFEMMDADELVREAPDALPLTAQATARGAHVRVENVVFGYTDGQPVLHDVSFEAGPGELVAVVGATGAGKSTLISLVPRLFDPWQGRVTIDGQDVRTLQLQSLRAQVGLVLQDAFVLPLSVAENIAYGRPDATRAEIEAAARAANAHEFVVRLPNGYDTVVGERGATLSGGERQRIAIARALLKDAPILILDEPTSALDATTEAALLDALERLMAGRTVLVIAHRLSTVRHADRIVVLEDGRVAEVGTHDQLLAQCGRYAEYCRLQFQVESPVAA